MQKSSKTLIHAILSKSKKKVIMNRYNVRIQDYKNRNLIPLMYCLEMNTMLLFFNKLIIMATRKLQLVKS